MGEVLAHDISIPAITVRREQAAAMLGISVSSFDRAARSGELGPMPVQRFGCGLYVIKELEDWVESGMPRREVWAEVIEKRKVKLKLARASA